MSFLQFTGLQQTANQVLANYRVADLLPLQQGLRLLLLFILSTYTEKNMWIGFFLCEKVISRSFRKKLCTFAADNKSNNN